MKTALQIGLTALLVGALAFYGGVMYGKATGGGGIRNAAGGGNAASMWRNGQGQNGQNGQNANANAARMRGGFANGEILSADAKSITVKTADGSTRTVYFDRNTRVVRSSEATLTDLTKGATVVVAGSTGDDGSVTARSVQIVPKGSNLGLFGGGARGFGQSGQNNQNAQQNGQQNNGSGGQGGFQGGPPDGGMGGPPPGF